MGLPANTSLDEESGNSPWMLQEDPPAKVETPSGTDGESQIAVSVPDPYSSSLGSEAKEEAVQPKASPPELPESLEYWERQALREVQEQCQLAV